MTYTVITSIQDIVEKYDTFLLDQWGVLHNGGDMFPNALKTLHMLKDMGKKVMILSNSGRPRTFTYDRMAHAGVTRDMYHDVMTSGDHIRYAYAQGRFDYLGNTPYIMYDDPAFEHLAGRDIIHTPLQDATYVLCCSPRGDESRWKSDLEHALSRGLEMVCSNPDRFACSPDGTLHYCPGYVADMYINMGGTVHYFGKPYAEMYTLCKDLAGGWGNAVCVGDSLHHDVLGAHTAGLDSVFITTGILNDSIMDRTMMNREKLESLIAHTGIIPTYCLDWF